MLPELALMGRELDRSRGAGETHDKERDPGHYIDLSDDGKVMGIVPLDKLPVTREAYDTQLRAGGVDAGSAAPPRGAGGLRWRPCDPVTRPSGVPTLGRFISKHGLHCYLT